MVEFVLGGSTDPAGHGAVLGLGALADLVEQLGWKPHGNEFGEPPATSAGRTLGLLVGGIGVEGVLLVRSHRFGLVGHRSSR